MSSQATADTLISIIQARRSIRQLNKSLGDVTTTRIQEIIYQTTLHTPSAFNSQPNRVLVLFGSEHDKLWDITTSILESTNAADSWERTAKKLAGLRAGAGTVLFFTDRKSIQDMKNLFPSFANEKLLVWAVQSNAIQQYLTWTALELEGLGANLQHYNPLIDQKVMELWDIPVSWKLDAQLVFGGKAGEAEEKSFKPFEERVKIGGA